MKHMILLYGLIGSLWTAGAIGLLVPRLCKLAASVALMIGAVITMVVNLGIVDTIVLSVFLAVAAFLAWTRPDRTRLAALAARRVR